MRQNVKYISLDIATNEQKANSEREYLKQDWYSFNVILLGY